MENSQELELEVFRAGDYGARGAWSEEQLDAIARDYDPGRHEAPVTLDHGQSGPAHGWVKSLRRVGDRLLATLTRLSPQLADGLRSGAWKKRSIELYRKFGDPGAPYLKAVSFLGAAAPAVRGLADPTFASDEGEVVSFDGPVDGAEAIAFAEGVRARLVAAGRWRPSWESEGLCDVFRALAGQGEAATLERILLATPAAAPFGQEATAGDPIAFSETLAGAAPSAESVTRHRAALRFLSTHPGVSYADALAAAAQA